MVLRSSGPQVLRSPYMLRHTLPKTLKVNFLAIE